MPIKNLDDSLFTDNEPKKAKPSKPELNFSADNTSEIYNELNKFMADMPDDMLDKFKDLSNSLSSKLEDVNLADLFNIEVNKVEIKNPYVTKLFQELTKYNEKELEDPVIVAKLIELTDFLNKYKTNKSEVVEEKINYIAKINELTDDILNIVVDKFNPEDFIKQYNFVLKDNNYVLEDLSNINVCRLASLSNQVKIIRLCGYKDWHDVIDEIYECDFIISSSLHGIIISDAYKIPNVWVEFSDNVIGKGFKFRDYYSSVNKTIKEPIRITDNTEIGDLIKCKELWRPAKINLNKLISACPFEILEKYKCKINGNAY